ncbi:DNA adenine methylase [Pleurocapsa sp. PCC 7319]|uniref:DNA adenine methylase n=1 Tax=Pleurocapsa sp. PCC 7319 TaxID=118161 RepID=UPI000346FF3D|nr:DNA adenine methylase [Pleurocapsa sp. PCC 7319]
MRSHQLKLQEIDSNIKAKPFVKWVGGKTQLLPELTSRIPCNFSKYFEPFAGGGALFFHMQPEQSILIDINEELTNTYRVIKYQTEELIADLKRHIYEKDYYYQIRNVDRTDEYKSWSDVQRASRLIYLNKSCFNGLYRVNSKGEFNTPMGRYKNPKIVDEINLRACSQALQKAQIINGSFLEVEEQVNRDDFVYFDPPYAPLNATSNFTGYSQNGFDLQMQSSLKNLCDRLDAKGVRFMVSNSNAPLILDLYSNYKIEFVYANRAINSQGDKRGKIPEVIISNY